MKMKAFSYNKFLIAFIALGLLAALVIDFARNGEEKANATVDMAIDYEGLETLAQREGLPLADVLAKFKDAGITSLAVYETTLKKLDDSGEVQTMAGSELIHRYNSGSLSDPGWHELVASGDVVASDVYITWRDPLAYRETKEELIRRLGAERVTPFIVDGQEALAVKANYNTLMQMNLGLPTAEMKAVNAAGFYVLARPSNYEDATDADVDAVFDRLQGIKISEVVFAGPQMLGAPNALNETIEQFRKHDLTLGLIEDPSQLQFYKQDGLNKLPAGIGYDRIARLYTIPRDEQPKLRIATAVERWANTDMERNIRIDFLRTYEKPAPGQTLLQTNLNYIQATHDALLAHGFQTGPASTFSSWYPSLYLRALVIVGVMAALVLYLSLVIRRFTPKWQVTVFIVLAIITSIPILLHGGGTVRLLAAFLSANIFPALAIIWQLDRIRNLQPNPQTPLLKIIVTAFIALVMSGIVSYIGAAYLSASLADVEFLLEFSIFRGIKLTFLLPIVLVAIAFMTRYDIFDGKMDDAEGVTEQLRRLLDMPIRLKTLLGIFALLFAVVVFIARSGHTSGMPVSNLELRFRAFLEQAFYARPRSKELLIGHPAFMLAAYAWQRKWPTMVLFFFVLVATIGQGSMVETFAHMRTPIYMSFMRGLGGLGLGGLLGAVCMVLVHIWQRLMAMKKERSRKA